MVWIHASEKVHFTPSFSSLFLVQKRLFLEKSQTYQNLFWFSSAYHLKRFHVGAGIMYFTMHKYLASTYKPVPEIRPFQYVSFSGNATPVWSYQIRAMTEQRLLSKVTGDEIDTREDVQLRLRVRCNNVFALARNLSIKVSNEFLWAHDKGFVQNRAFAELAYQFRSLRLSTGYMNWYLKGIQKPIRHVWLCRIDHKLKFSK